MEFFAPVIDLEHEVWTPTLSYGSEYNRLMLNINHVILAYRILYTGASRIAWMSDNSGIARVREKYNHVPREVFERFVEASKSIPAENGRLRVRNAPENEIAEFSVWRKEKILLNHSKNLYVSLDQFGAGYSGVDVLPYLTVVTIPDIMKDNTVLPYDGSWAFDKLSLSKEIPNGFTRYAVTGL